MRQSELSAEGGTSSPWSSPATVCRAALGGRGRTQRPADGAPQSGSLQLVLLLGVRRTRRKVCELAVDEGGGAWERLGLGTGWTGTRASCGEPRRVSREHFAARTGGDGAPVVSCSAVSCLIYCSPLFSSRKSAYLLINVSGIFHLLLISVSTSNST